MDDLDLKLITEDTLRELIILDVVTPQMYESVFQLKLKEKDKALELDNLKIDTVMQNLKKISNLQKETCKSAQDLQDSIDLATTAIDKKDVDTLLEVKDHMKELQEKINKLENEVYLDSLTKIYNRKWIFDKMLDDGKFKSDGVIVFVDLDKFKSINDTYGHLAGDKVLLLVANLLVKISNSSVARFGGDEFVIFSKDHSVKKIEQELDLINKSFETKSLRFQDHTFKIGLSYGAHTFKKGESYMEITQIVDKKMYAQKEEKKQKELA